MIGDYASCKHLALLTVICRLESDFGSKPVFLEGNFGEGGVKP